MKRPFLCLILVFVLLVSLFCPVSFAAEADNPEEETKYFSGDYTYAIVKGGGPEGKDSAKIVSFNSDSTNVAVPEALDGLPVTHIDELAFFQCDSLREISLPDSITHIGDYAFDCCFDLTLVVERDSYAANWANESGINYRYSD